MVTDRMMPLTVDGPRVHQVGLPYHWGRRGLVKGDAVNDLLVAGARPERAHPGVEGGDVRHQARAAAQRRAGARRVH